MTDITLYEALENWKNREQNLQRLLSAQTLDAPYYLKKKLAHFRELYDRYNRDETVKADVALKAVKDEIRQLEKKLYPSPGERLLRRFIAGTQLYFGPARLLENEHRRIEESKQREAIEKAFQFIPSIQKKSLHEASEQQKKVTTEAATATVNEISNHLNTTQMNDKNYDYLSKQLTLTGFGEDLHSQLKEQLQKQQPEFMLTYQKNYGNDSTVATLHFKKSAESDMYFFNRYNLLLQNPKHPDPLKQTFYINQHQDNVTLKEGYNLLSGRAVHKELKNKEGQEYKAWVQLDFKQTDKNGNYKMHPYNENYGFNLEQSLNRHTIKEMADPEKKVRLIESLERGNRQTVTMDINGNERKLAIEAAPRFKSLNIYEMNGVRIRADKLYESKEQEQLLNQKEQKTLKHGAGDEGDSLEGKSAKKRRNRQSIQ